MNEEIIKENLKRVENGEPLTMPLSILNGEFKREYKKKYGEFERQDAEEKKAYHKAYLKTDKYKAYLKAYQKTDKYKAYQKAYYQRKKSEVKQDA